mmetsp:Transcript_65239/g.165379  ORF Transcript_65239/g.165379 Transcript_65239/m.165379 type:complete len:528 (+) Transcript_65239:53-1636(+)
MGVVKATKSALESLVKPSGFDVCNGIRGIAVLWVCSTHGINYIKPFWPATGQRLFGLWWPVALPVSGEVGVDLFLVLSGFLIGGALQKETDGEGTPAWGKFCVRRLFRIFPAIASATLATAVADYLADEPAGCPNTVWYTNFFIFNNFPGWGGSETVTCLRQTWSVSLELQLYLATPFLFMMSMRLSSLSNRLSVAGCAVALCAFGWALCCAIRVWGVFHMDLVDHPQSTWWSLFHFYMPTQFRFSTYLAGVAAGVVVVERKKQQAQPLVELTSRSQTIARIVFTTACIVLACSCVFGGDLQAVANHQTTAWYRTHLQAVAVLHVALLRPLIGAAVAVILVFCALGMAPRTARFLGAAAWRPLAGLSYSMYLMQFVGIHLLMKPFMLAVASSGGLDEAPLWVCMLAAYTATVLFILGCIPLALLNYVLVERVGITAGSQVLALLARGTCGQPSSKPAACQDPQDIEAQLSSASSSPEILAEKSMSPTVTEETSFRSSSPRSVGSSLQTWDDSLLPLHSDTDHADVFC